MKFDTPKEFESKIKDELPKLCSNDKWCFNDLLSLKEYLHSINNHITYLMGRAFLNKCFGIEEECELEYFKYTEMNHNGYDIVAKIKDSLIIAEIKGNIPCGKDDKYGANQKNSIKKDIDNLKIQKTTGKKQINDLSNFEDAYKCLVLLENNSDAIKDLIDDNFVTLKDNDITFENLQNDKINIILIKL